MIKLVTICLLLLSACATHIEKRYLKEIDHVESAKRHIFDLENILYAEQHLQQALSEHNSDEAAVLLSRLEIGKWVRQVRKEILKPKSTWNEKVISLTTPFISTNGEAAYLYGLAHYPVNSKEALNGFLKATEMNIPEAMIYAASIIQWDLKDNERAYQLQVRASQLNCPAAISNLDMMENNEFQDLRYLELINLGAKSLGVNALNEKADYLEELSKEETAYFRDIAKRKQVEFMHLDSLPIYDINIACRYGS